MSRCYAFVDANTRWLPAAENCARNRDFVIPIFFDPSPDVLETWANISTKVFVCNHCCASELRHVLQQIAQDFGMPVVMCETDQFLLQVAYACQHANIPFSSYDSILNARDKYRTRLLTSKSSRLHVQRTYNLTELSSLANRVGYPCILKPAAGTGSCLTYPAYNTSHVDWYINEVKSSLAKLSKESQWFAEFGWICETLICGPMVTAFVAADGVDVKTFAVARNIGQSLSECIGFGSITPAISGDKLSMVHAFAEARCRDIDLNYGIFDVEIILSKGGPELVEINPRPPGGQMLSALSLATDGDVLGFIMDIYSGYKVALYPPFFNKEVLIWKLMPAENGVLKESIECALSKVVPKHIQYHYHPLPHRNDVKQLDCLARVLFPCESGEQRFALLRDLTVEMSRLIGVELLLGELSMDW